jgi:hypothetical protein
MFTKLKNQPWRILNFGFFLQMTYKRPLRFTILQSSLRFLMDVLTFMVIVLLFVSERNATFSQVVRRHFDPHLVAGQDPDVMHAHLAGDVCDNGDTVVELYAKHGVGEGFDDGSFFFDE